MCWSFHDREQLHNARDLLLTLHPPALDFYDAVRLVNYIRSEVKAGKPKPEIVSKQAFQDDKYLQPVLEDDALLFNLDEILEEQAGEGASTTAHGESGVNGDGDHGTINRVDELKAELQRLQAQFLDYRQAVKKTLDEGLDVKDDSLAESTSPAAASKAGQQKDGKGNKPVDDSHYFVSYSYNGEAPIGWIGFWYDRTANLRPA